MLAPGQIAFLPVDLGRWDRSPGGDVLVVPLWTDVRPLRGVAGLLDWRLNGRLSQLLREQKLQGEAGEKMLFFNERVPWKRILAVGLGATQDFSEKAFKTGFRSAFDSFRGLGIKSVAMALPGRDMERITPERAMRMLLALMGSHEEQNPLAAIEALTIIDVPPAIKAMTETVKSLEKAVIADIEITWSDQEERPHEEASPVEAAPPPVEAAPPPVEEDRPVAEEPHVEAKPHVEVEPHVEAEPQVEAEPHVVEAEPHVEVDLHGVEEPHVEVELHGVEEPHIVEKPHVVEEPHVVERLHVLQLLDVLEKLPVREEPPVADMPPVEQEPAVEAERLGEAMPPIAPKRPDREEGPEQPHRRRRRRRPGGKSGHKK